MFKRMKTKETKNEVTIRLLPEKAKNDYLLRSVSMIIIMIFIIINFFTLFLPRVNRISQINALKRDNYVLSMEEQRLRNEYNAFPRNFYDITKNNDYLAIEAGQLDTEVLVSDIKDALSRYTYSYLERVDYDAMKHQLVINVQFIQRGEVDDFFFLLEEVEYVEGVFILSHVQTSIGGGLPRHKVVYEITLNPELAPQVGDQHD